MICVFDIETIPDAALIRNVLGYEGDDYHVSMLAMKEQEEKSGSSFLPLPFHKIVAVSAVIADDFGMFRKVSSIEGANEHEMVKNFLHFINQKNPKLVSFNGRSFDMPLLMLRAMQYNLTCSAYFEAENKELNKNKWENYRARYSDRFHVDVMDHHFVPNLTLGEPIVARICQVTDLPVDVHLMIEDPDRWAPEYAKLGAASVSFHMGATHAPVRLARQLRDMGCKACFAVRPAEPVEPIFDILDEFDMVLIMTVEPGFGGQKFLDNQMAKVRRLRDEITRRGLKTKIQVDGGVSPKTAHIVAEAGADVLVAGSAVYGAENPAEAIDSIREKAEAAFKA